MLRLSGTFKALDIPGLIYVCSHYYPIKTHHCPKWFTPALQHQLNQLHTLRQKFSSNPSPINQAKLQSAEQNFQLTASGAKHNYENNLINQFFANRNSSIYKYLSFLTNHSSFPTTMHYNTSSASTDLNQVHLFNEYFFSVFNRDSSPVFISLNDVYEAQGPGNWSY